MFARLLRWCAGPALVAAVLATAWLTFTPDSATVRPVEPGRPTLARFSSAPTGAALSPEWTPWTVDPRKPATRYTLVQKDGAMVLEASAQASVSALIHPLAGAMAKRLRWRWNVPELIAEADERQAQRDDSPARVLVAFSGDRESLPPPERAKLELAAALSGRELPYATLMYVWSARYPPGSVIENPRSSRVRMIVVEQGAEQLGRWREYERDLAADFRRAFGEEPGPLAWIGVMTDADDTGGSARAHFGDLVLLSN